MRILSLFVFCILGPWQFIGRKMEMDAEGWNEFFDNCMRNKFTTKEIMEFYEQYGPTYDVFMADEHHCSRWAGWVGVGTTGYECQFIYVSVEYWLCYRSKGEVNKYFHSLLKSVGCR